MTVADAVAEILETAFRLVPVPVRTQVRVLGNPDRMSPVFLTGNYDLTVRRVLRSLRGVDGYLIVASSNGVNVWCASSGGHLTTHQVVTALKVAALEEKVAHREVILPQLAATGVEGKEVRRRTGWIVRFGPADVADVPEYLAAGKQKNDRMRRVRFGARQRLEMAASWAAPIALIGSAFAWHHLLAFWVLVWAMAVAVFLAYDRLPVSDLVRRAVFAVAGISAIFVLLGATGTWTGGRALLWGAAALVVTGILTFDFAGSTPTQPAGMFKEKEFRIALDLERCTGAYNCWAVCPEACFVKRAEIHKIELTHGDRCIRCGACVVQCPQDALAFEMPDGWRVDPNDIRRFKLNLLGQRARRVSG